MGRVLMSYFASKYVRIVTGLPIHDTTAGFKCYRRQVLETIDLDHIRFKGYAFHILIHFCFLGECVKPAVHFQFDDTEYRFTKDTAVHF